MFRLMSSCPDISYRTVQQDCFWIMTGKMSKFTRELNIYYSIAKESWVYMLAITITSITMFAVHPAVTALVQPVSKNGNAKSEWEEIYFVPVCCFVLFHIGNLLGKIMATSDRLLY